MTVAAVDIGTNSVRLLITDDQGRELERSMHITRLGQGVDEQRALRPDAIARTVAVLSNFGARISAQGARVRAAATSATRDASNGAELLDAAERALGARPQVLSGEEEARLSFQGATAGLCPDDGPFLVVDIGGGSTEFVLGTTEPERVISVQMGCVRMTERHLRTDPPTPEQVEAATADVRRELTRVHAAMDVARARRMIGLAGTVTALSALTLGLAAYDASRTHRSILTRSSVEASFERLRALDVDGRRGVLAEPARAESILGGAIVLATILRDFGVDALQVSEHDILDGLAASLRSE